MPKSNMEIAETIKQLAKERRVTLKKMLEDCSINHNFMNDISKGNSSPSVDKISRIAEYLGVSTARILDGADGEIATLLALYEKLSPESKAALRAYMQSLIEA
ncbi:MAG: helix-turn-helix transcriptional regulator [Clostridia bacterium]|nr:helix-turn-helix transcriptional regulator [Clostridia bacterium]